MDGNLATRAANKIRELRRTIEMLMQSKDKSGKSHDCCKRDLKRKILALTEACIDLRQVIMEKDKLIRLQGVKMREVLYANDSTKVNMLKNEFEALSKLANPEMHIRGVPSISHLNKERMELLQELGQAFGKNNTIQTPSGKKTVKLRATSNIRQSKPVEYFHNRSRSFAHEGMNTFDQQRQTPMFIGKIDESV